ncbi:hypothetical protein [Jiangella anatolica]|uniref:hypothetical protein n=1 Tax=Jiangella anatolica TaxID=2670374 RepID=UPI0011B79BE9|nr:hypothetical protein [Jiangella anatolica]
MTTTTLAPVENEDLEAWLNHEIEKPCDAGTLRSRCSNQAEYLAHIRRPCGCAAPTSVFWCSYHKDRYESYGLACRDCHSVTHAVGVQATFVERIR